MDTPFILSGAMSRAQYSLVRKVENAASPQAVDQILLNELEVIRRNLQKPHLSMKESKECLVLILHCTMTLSTAGSGDLEFAFPHAVNLAELGRSAMDKKIGYIFCIELMPPNHELQLMLVNTLRKDLESACVARICLALDVLLQVSNEDVIPAVDARLQTLLQHESLAVRRRALLAYHTLFQGDTERLVDLEVLVQRRIRAEPYVITSMSTIAGKFKHSESLGRLLNSQFRHHYRESGKLHTVLPILRTLYRGEMKLEPENAVAVLDIIKRAAKVPMRAILRELFVLLSTVSSEVLRESQSSLVAIASIRHFLSSREPNDLYLFVSCLSCLDPSIWAGTYPNTIAVFDEWEVQGVMRLLDMPDGLIRKMTLKILNSVDPIIVETYYSQTLNNLSPSLSLFDKNEYVSLLLEVLDIQDADDVDQYARRLKDLLSVIEGEEQGATVHLPVLELGVQRILGGIRERDASSRVSCITALAVPLTEREVRVGPTLMVVISALVSEYCSKISISPVGMLGGIAVRLSSYAPSVQDACLLTMLRLSVECDEIPDEVTAAVCQLSQHSGTHLRRRCDQFLTLSTQRRVLSDIISRAQSSSLPDFLSALTCYQSTSSATSSRTALSGNQGSLNSPSPRGGVTFARKLRYEAYTAPQPTPSLRHLSSPRRLRGSVSSSDVEERSSSRASDGASSLQELTKTVTPGELTLAAAQSPLGVLEAQTGQARTTTSGVQLAPDDPSSRTNLITLDSPSIAEPVKQVWADADFKATWDSMENTNLRGWCEASLDMIVRGLQSLQYRMRVIATDQPPFEGELKVLVQGPEPGQHATLRLREGEEESCLWRLRCDDMGLRMSIKRLMEDM